MSCWRLKVNSKEGPGGLAQNLVHVGSLPSCSLPSTVTLSPISPFFLLSFLLWMDGWIPSTIGLPPPKKKHALPKPPTEARQHNEEGVNLVPGSIGSVRLDVKGSRNGPKELKLRFLAQQDPGECSFGFWDLDCRAREGRKS